MLRNGKKLFFQSLNCHNNKQFWKAKKYLRKQISSIPTLSHNNVTSSTDQDKANMLNSFFSTCFNRSQPALEAIDSLEYSLVDECPDDILCTETEISEQFANAQWGFQNEKSTITALLGTTYDWFQMLDSGKDVCAVFFDIQKAFDTIPLHALMQKLQHTGLNNHILHWICSYLTNREQQVLDSGQRTSCVLPTDQLCTTVPLITDKRETTPIFHAGI